MEDVNQAFRQIQQARNYYQRNTTKKLEEKEEKKDSDQTTTTAKKLGELGKSAVDVIKKAKEPHFTFDKSTGTKIGAMIDNPLKASINELSPIAKEYAEIVKISTLIHKEGMFPAKRRLSKTYPGYTIDEELSTDHYAVVKKPNGKIVIGFRGTDPKAKIQTGIGKGMNEPIQWLFIQAGQEQNIFDEHKLVPIKNKILSKYRPDQIEHISGYSMGGTKAHRLADMLGVDSHLFNPFLGKNFFEKPLTPNTNHQIIRTTEDIASALRVFKNKKMPKNVKVDSIDPIQTVKMKAKKIHSQAATDLQAFNLLDNHNLEHFTSEGDRTNLQYKVDDEIRERVRQFEISTRGLSSDSPEFKRLQESMIEDLKPTMKLSQQDTHNISTRAKLFNNLKPSNIVTALAGIGGGAGVDSFIQSVESTTGVDIDDHITTAVSGGLGALPETTVAKFLGGKVNFARALTGGIAGAVAQELTTEGTDAALRAAGVPQETSMIVSQTVGGGVGGAVTAGGTALARQIGLRLAARAAATVGAEATASALGAEIGSVVPGAGTLIGLSIGALVGLGIGLIDHNSRLWASRTQAENEMINTLIEYGASGADPNDLINQVEDSVERQRLRRFMKRGSQQEALARAREEYRHNRAGISEEDQTSILDYVRTNVPDFDTMTNKQKNDAIADLITNNQDGRLFIFNYSYVPFYDETDDTNTETQIARKGSMKFRGNQIQHRRDYLESPQYVARQARMEWLVHTLENDEEFNASRTASEANQRIYDLLNEMRPELFQAQGITDDEFLAQQFWTVDGSIPQFTATGEMVIQPLSAGVLKIKSDPVLPPRVKEEPEDPFAGQYKSDEKALLKSAAGDTRFRGEESIDTSVDSSMIEDLTDDEIRQLVQENPELRQQLKQSPQQPSQQEEQAQEEEPFQEGR